MLVLRILTESAGYLLAGVTTVCLVMPTTFQLHPGYGMIYLRDSREGGGAEGPNGEDAAHDGTKSRVGYRPEFRTNTSSTGYQWSLCWS